MLPWNDILLNHIEDSDCFYSEIVRSFEERIFNRQTQCLKEFHTAAILLAKMPYISQNNVCTFQMQKKYISCINQVHIFFICVFYIFSAINYKILGHLKNFVRLIIYCIS